MRNLSISVDSGEFQLAVEAARGLNLTLEEFAERCVQKLAKASPVALDTERLETILTPASLQSGPWAEAIAIAKKRVGKK